MFPYLMIDYRMAFSTQEEDNEDAGDAFEAEKHARAEALPGVGRLRICDLYGFLRVSVFRCSNLSFCSFDTLPI